MNSLHSTEEQDDLLQFLLEKHEKNGGQVLLPMGVEALEPWLLRTIDPVKLIGKLRAGKMQIDITECSRNAMFLMPHSVYTASRPSSVPHTAPSSMHGRDDPEDDLPERKISPTLPGMDTGLQDDEVKEIAFMLFLVLCGHQRLDKCDIWDAVTVQLGVGEEHSLMLKSLLEQKALLIPAGATRESWPAMAVGSEAAHAVPHMVVDLYANLLPAASRQGFKQFRAFTLFRDTATGCCTRVLASLVELKPQEDEKEREKREKRERRERKKGKEGAGEAEKSPEQGCLRHLMAAVRGAARRVTEPKQADFHDLEHADGVKFFCAAVSTMCKAIAQRNLEYTALRVSVAETLLLAMHDDVSDDGYIEQKDAYAKLLQQCVFPALGVDTELHQALDAWVHFKQYLQSGDDAKLVQVKKCLKVQPSQQGRPSSGASPRKAAAVNAAPQAVYQAMQEHLFSSLRDFFHEYSGPEQLSGVLDVAMFVAAGMGRDLTETLEGFIEFSLERQLTRLWDKASEKVAEEKVDEDVDEEIEEECVAHVLAAYAASVQDFIGLCMEFATGLENHSVTLGNEPAAVILANCHRFAGDRYQQWLITVDVSADDVLASEEIEAVQACEELERSFVEALAQVTGAPGKVHTPESVGLQGWAGLVKLQPVLFQWVQMQCKGMAGLIDRMAATERWDRPVSDAQHISCSAKEMERLTDGALQAMFDMRLPLPAQVVRGLLEGIEGVLRSYTNSLKKGMENPAALIRPPPPLTRYKEDLATKAEKEAALARVELEAKDPEYAAALATYQTEFKRAEKFMTDNLLLRMNTAYHLVSVCANIEETAKEKYAEVLEAAGQDPSKPLSWLDDCLATSKQELKRATAMVRNYLSHHAVFVGLAPVWHDKLYMHRVHEGNTAIGLKLIDDLNDIMGNVLSKAHPDLITETAANVARCTFAALIEVVLNGGEFRNFVQHDAHTIACDLDAFKELFYAEGQGVKMPELKNTMSRITDILNAMGLDTELLCSNMTASRASPDQCKGKGACHEYQFLLHILSHRADKAASKYLKKEVKMPKLDGRRGGYFW